MFIVVSKYLVPKGYRGITFFPFIIVNVKSLKQNPIVINHEKIHIRQQLELLIFPFFLWYFLEFLIRYLQYKNRKEAYRNISFEREAYKNETSFNYLKKRGLYSFLKYI